MTTKGFEDYQKMLKPCPFCGSDVVYLTFENGYLDNSVIVFCNTCKVSVKHEDNDQEGWNKPAIRKAVGAWNRRLR